MQIADGYLLIHASIVFVYFCTKYEEPLVFRYHAAATAVSIYLATTVQLFLLILL